MISWLFEIGTKNLSTKNLTWDSKTYSGLVIPSSFYGVTMRWDISGSGLIAPNDMEFEVSNVNGTYSVSDFEGEYCLLRLVVDNTNIRSWKFKISRALSYYGKIKCYCDDFLQEYLDGDYPNSKKPKEIWPSSDSDINDSDTYCVPVILGEAYIPLRSVNTGTERYYVLGSDDKTYTISEVQSPREWPNNSTWESPTYDMDQSTDSGYKLLQPKIDDRVDPLATGLWPSGDSYYDMPCKFSRSDTVSLTNPAEWIEYVLKDFGISASDIDATSFATAESNYDTLGIEFPGGGWWEKSSKESILSNLLAHVDSYIKQTDKIELHQFSTSSQETITNVLSLSYAPTRVTKSSNDSGSVSWPESTDEPMDELNGTAVVPSHNGGTENQTASTTLECKFFPGDSVNAQKAGILYFGKKYEQKNKINLSVTLSTLTNKATLSPGNVITINNDLYGGSTDVIITEMTINPDNRIDLTCVELNYLEDWSGVSPSSITVVDDTSSGFDLVDRYVRLSADSFIFRYDSSGDPDPDPQTITITATALNIDNSSYAFTTAPNVKSQTSASNEFTLSTDDVGANDSVTITVTCDSKTDSITVKKVFDGADGSTGVDGLNQATLFLFQRSSGTPVTTDIADPVTYTFSTKTITGSTGSWTTTVPSGTNPLYVTTSAAVSAEGTDNIPRSEWSTPVILADNGLDGSDGSDGIDGLNTAVVFLYIRSASTPTKPTTTSTYTFSTGVLTGHNNGWSQNVPATNGDPLWVIQSTATDTDDIDTILSTEWGTQIKLVEDGADGADGATGPTGPAGDPGPGLVYRGPFEAGTYYNTSIRRDVVEYSGTYYIYNVSTGTSGNYESAWSSGDWETFASTFEAVATKLLLTENATITKTLTMGSGGIINNTSDTYQIDDDEIWIKNSDGLRISNGANVLVDSGGDVVFRGINNNPGSLLFAGTTGLTACGVDAGGNYLCFWPSLTPSGNGIGIGYRPTSSGGISSTPFEYLALNASITIRTTGDIVPTVSLADNLGSPALKYDKVYANEFYGDGSNLTGVTGSSYTHPTHPGDDFSVDTGSLSGATVVSDIDINVTTDSLGHVTDANGSVSTRTLTLANLGYTGDANANYYTHPGTIQCNATSLALGTTSSTAYRGDYGNAAYAHKSNNGSDHSYIDQSVTTGSNPTFGSPYFYQKLIHSGDTDTYIDFTTNRVQILAGGNTRLDCQSTKTIIPVIESATVVIPFLGINYEYSSNIQMALYNDGTLAIAGYLYENSSFSLDLGKEEKWEFLDGLDKAFKNHDAELAPQELRYKIYDEDGFGKTGTYSYKKKSADYIQILVETVNELKSEIETLKAEIEALKNAKNIL